MLCSVGGARAGLIQLFWFYYGYYLSAESGQTVSSSTFHRHKLSLNTCTNIHYSGETEANKDRIIQGRLLVRGQRLLSGH